jgi:hypothetical protein
MIFGVYLLIRKRAVLRYIRCLRAGYRLPAGKHAGILTHFRTKVNKKTQKSTFWSPFFLLKSKLYPVQSP